MQLTGWGKFRQTTINKGPAVFFIDDGIWLKMGNKQVLKLMLAFLCVLSAVSAQFQFFDQFFGTGQQQAHHEKQNVASDSGWYQHTWESGEYYLSQLDISEHPLSR